MEKKKVGTFEIPATLWEAFKHKAKEENRSASAQIRHMIREFVRRK